MTPSSIFLAGLLLLSLSYRANSEALPDYLQVCHRSVPLAELEECVKKSIEILRPYLTRGIPELEVPKIDPLYLGDFLKINSNTGLNLLVTTSDVNVYNAGNFQLKKLRIIKIVEHFVFDVDFPHIRAEGLYNVTGQILAIPIKGNGRFEANLSEIHARVVMRGDTIKMNGEDYFNIKSLDIKTKFKDGNIKLFGLFGGDKALGEVINETINTNFKAISEDFLPLIEKAFEKVFLRIGNKIAHKYTFDQLLPE